MIIFFSLSRSVSLLSLFPPPLSPLLSPPYSLFVCLFVLAADSKTVPYPSSSEHYYMGRVYIC